MRVPDVLVMSLQAIVANKLRSVLTLVGIVAGVASIIAVMTGISVIQGAMEREMSVLGAQTFQVQKWPAGGFGGAEARRKARRASQRGGHQLSKQTLDAADWVILITSLKPNDFATADVLALYRLRWRIELAFKRLKSLIGLKGPPGTDERSARPHVLAHLLTILLLEPFIDELEDSPRLAEAA